MQVELQNPQKSSGGCSCIRLGGFIKSTLLEGQTNPPWCWFHVSFPIQAGAALVAIMKSIVAMKVWREEEEDQVVL